MKLTTTHLIDLIKALPINTAFDYVNTKSRSTVEIIGIDAAAGVISIKRTTKNGGVKESRLNLNKLSAIAAGLKENNPISIDDLLRNNDNVRSAIEAILVRTAEIYTYTINNHKTLVWVPTKPHTSGIIKSLTTEDYGIVSYDKEKPLTEKLLNSTLELINIQIAETKKVLKTLREETRRTEELLMRQESLLMMLSNRA